VVPPETTFETNQGLIRLVITLSAIPPDSFQAIYDNIPILQGLRPSASTALLFLTGFRKVSSMNWSPSAPSSTVPSRVVAVCLAPSH